MIVRSDIGGSNSSGPVAVIALVLLLGATIYLFRLGYMRRTTAVFTAGLLAIALAAVSLWVYRSGG